MAKTKANQKRRKEVFDLLWKAENEGITEYKKLAEYILEATGTKVSYDTIQQYKIDRNAQEMACGIKMAEKQLAMTYIDNPKLLYPELLWKIKNLKPNKTNQKFVNLLSWLISIALVGIAYIGYLFYTHKTSWEMTKVILKDENAVSALSNFDKGQVSGYLFVDFAEELPQNINGIMVNEDKELVAISKVDLEILRKYLQGQSGSGELVIEEKQ